MGKEIEASFYNVDRNRIVKQLGRLGAKAVGSYKMRRMNFQVASEGKADSQDYYTCWVRVRTDDRRSTLTLKEQRGTSITGRNEYEVEIGNFEDTVRILARALHGASYDYFENHREVYMLDGIEVVIDKFPYLPYLLEIEGNSKEAVDAMVARLEIDGEPDPKKSVPTAEYYRMHGEDYEKVQNSYSKKIAELIG